MTDPKVKEKIKALTELADKQFSRCEDELASVASFLKIVRAAAKNPYEERYDEVHGYSVVKEDLSADLNRMFRYMSKSINQAKDEIYENCSPIRELLSAFVNED